MNKDKNAYFLDIQRYIEKRTKEINIDLDTAYAMSNDTLIRTGATKLGEMQRLKLAIAQISHSE